MKISNTTQHFIIVILLLLVSTLYVFAFIAGFKSQNIELNKLHKISSIVENTGEIVRVGSKGRPKVFFVKLAYLNKKLGVYRMSRNYNDLLSEISIGDSITAYYFESQNKRENVNISLVQIEKNGKAILEKSEYQNKESSLMYIGILGIIANIIIYYRFYKKIHKKSVC